MYFFDVVFLNVVAQCLAGESAVGDAFFKASFIYFFVEDPTAVFSKPAKTRAQIGANSFAKYAVRRGGDGMMRIKINGAAVGEALLNAVV